MVNKAHRLVYKNRDYEGAQKVVRNELFKDHMNYEDLKDSNLKMEYIKLSKEQSKFKESLDYFKRHSEFLKTNQYYQQ